MVNDLIGQKYFTNTLHINSFNTISPPHTQSQREKTLVLRDRSFSIRNFKIKLVNDELLKPFQRFDKIWNQSSRNLT